MLLAWIDTLSPVVLSEDKFVPLTLFLFLDVVHQFHEIDFGLVIL